MKKFVFNKKWQDLDQVKPYYKQFKKIYDDLAKKNEYPYNYFFKNKIKGIEGEDEDEAIFLLQRLNRKIEKEKYRKKMLSEGWFELSEEIVKKALEQKKKILLKAKYNNGLCNIKIERKFKPHLFGNEYGLMELRARTRGYGLWKFEDAYCKLVK